MKRILAICLFVMLFSTGAFAHSVGIALGNPTGVNAQYELAPDRVIEATGGLEFGDTRPDFLLNYYKKQEDKYYLQAYDLDFYYGGGIKVKKGFGANGSLAVAHPIEGQQLELYGATALTAYFLGADGLELDLFGGIRYVF